MSVYVCLSIYGNLSIYIIYNYVYQSINASILTIVVWIYHVYCTFQLNVCYFQQTFLPCFCTAESNSKYEYIGPRRLTLQRNVELRTTKFRVMFASFEASFRLWWPPEYTKHAQTLVPLGSRLWTSHTCSTYHLHAVNINHWSLTATGLVIEKLSIVHLFTWTLHCIWTIVEL